MRPKKVILLVDDNEQALGVRRFLLETRGYAVLSASSAEEALQLAELAIPYAIDLLLTDYVMPQMTGNELVCRFREMHPGTPTMIVSGLVADPALNHDAHFFLAKGECYPALLLERVRTLCTRKHGPKKPPQPFTAKGITRTEAAC